MKCHYTNTETGKVWIPGCYGGLYGPGGCTCRSQEEVVPDKYKEEIKELRQENARLNRIIKKLTSKTQKRGKNK